MRTSARLFLPFVIAGCAGAQGAPPPKKVEPAPVVTLAPERTTFRQDTKIPVSSDDPILGSPSAPITIVMFGDYQCPFCRRVLTTLGEVRDRYGDDVRIVWKDLPLDFHVNAESAAVAARVAFLAKGNDAFWKIHQRMFSAPEMLDEASYVQWLSEVGVDEATYRARREEALAQVRDSVAFAKQLGVQGTPNFYVDGQHILGAQPLKVFAATIDAHLEKVRELRKAGVQPMSIYGALVAVYGETPPPQADADEDPDKETPSDFTVWNATIGDAPVKGPKDARITIVLFEDFQCPFCKRLEPTLARIDKEYAGKVRFVWKNQPLSFHNRALPAAIAAYEVRRQKGDAAFWQYHDALFAKQPSLEDQDLVDAASQIGGIDLAKLRQAITAQTWKSEVMRDVDQAEELNVQGTPHAFVNGRVVSGARAFDYWKKVIDQELPKADARVQAGTPADRVYAETIKGGKGGPLAPVAIPASAPSKGKKDAPVTIQVFADFQCPFCKRAVVAVPDANGKVDEMSAGLRASEAKYKNKLRIVWRNFPLAFHTRARPVANFALEVFAQKGASAFWKAHDELFRMQPKLEDADLEPLAKLLSVDWSKAKSAMDGDRYKSTIEADIAAGGAIGVTGTPAFVVQNKTRAKLVIGAQPADAFFRVIDLMLQ